MRRFIYFLFAIFGLSFTVNAATITWDGGGSDGMWSTPGNWVGEIVPTAVDDVVLDNSIVIAGYAVNLPGGDISVSVNSLTITPATGNFITLRLPVTNTSMTGFTATRPGDAIVLNNGAIFINSSGAASGATLSVSGTGFFRINNGARYVHNTIRAHAALAARLSTAPGTETGIFEFDIPDASTTISLSGRTYGTLILSSTAFGAPLTYSGNGGMPLQVRGDFWINTGVTFSIGMSADMIVNGNYMQAVASTFNLQNANPNNVVRLNRNVTSQGVIIKSGTGLPVIELNGTSIQNISITGNIVGAVALRINNNAGATLISTLRLPFSLILLNGKIRTDALNIITLADNVIVTGGSSTSFIEGPMVKVGDDPSFTFPVGKGSIYSPISFNSTGLAVTDAFQAEYFRLNPHNSFGTNYEPPFDHVSYVEYWQLNKILGSLSVPVNVSLSITPYSFAEVMNTTYISRFNTGDGQWKNSGTLSRVNGTPVPPNVTGTIQSVPLTALGVFTLATTDPFATNPLPLKIISFNAVATPAGDVEIKWNIAADKSEQVYFEVQRSENGKDFETIRSFYSVSDVENYLIKDRISFTKVWYRLRLIDKNGVVVYSRTAIVINKPRDFLITVFPNPSQGNSSLLINSLINAKASVLVHDVSGKMIEKREVQISPGNNKIVLNTQNLTSGIFTISIVCEEGVQTIRFVKL